MLADQGAIEDVLAVENDVVPCRVDAFLCDSLRAHRPCDLLACQLASRRKNHGQVSRKMGVLIDDI